MLRYILLFTFFLGIHTFTWAQPANDDCDDAIVLTGPFDGTCTAAFDATGATSDIAGGGCFIYNQNMWFSFVADDTDLVIDVTVGAGYNAFVSVVEFTGATCTFAGAIELGCGSGSAGAGDDVIDIGGLTIGNTYYLNVTVSNNAGAVDETIELCLTNLFSAGPPNDLPCDAEVISGNGACIPGTTFEANSEYGSIPGCADAPENGVFYEITIDPGNLGLDIDLNNTGFTGDISVVLGQFTVDCNDVNLTLNEVYCGPAGTDVINALGLTPGETYVIYIATTTAGAGTFELCATQYGPPADCSNNNFCDQAETLTIASNAGFVCVDGCNLFASPEPGLGGCNMATEEVVWYTMTTDGSATLATFSISGVEIEAPTIQVFTGNCGGLTQFSDCITGANFSVSIVNAEVTTNTTYYIAVSNSFGDGGYFEFCALTLDNPNSCTVDSELTVQGTSLGSPFEGPYQPNEVVSFCYTINEFTAAGNGCQWLQGIVPIFGDGWDPSSFGPTGVPNSNTGVSSPAVNNGVWAWFTDVDYNFDTTNKIIDDFDGDGVNEMCHFTEPDCPIGATTLAGTICPPGWYAWTASGGDANPGQSGHPDVDWGDGSGCGAGQGPWQVCFDLTARPFPMCEEEPSYVDLSIRVYTFADGETGAYNGSNTTCALDIPVISSAVLNCCLGPELDNLDDTVCPGGTTDIQLTSNQTGDITYNWTVVPNPNVSGAADGSGEFITQQLDNNTTSSQIIYYEVTAISEEGCYGLPTLIPVTVLPAINVDAGPEIDGCAQGEFSLGGSPTATGGAGFFSYEWNNPSVANVANPTASPNLTKIYTVVVTDNNGCTASDQVQLNISPNFDVEISGDTILCPGDAVTNLSGAPLGGTPNYTFDWSPPIGSNFNGQVFPFNGNVLEPGDYVVTLTVTDDNGCTGDREVLVDILLEPSVFIASTPPNGQFCPGGSVILQSAVVGGEPGATFTYNWTSPLGNDLNGNMITASESGIYSLEVFDNILGCTSMQTFEVEEVAPPEPEIEAPTGICGSEMVSITTDQMYETYEWGDGEVTDSIMVGPGTYFVTVTNSAGCEGSATITVNPLPDPIVSIGGSSTFCVGSSSTLSVSSDFSDFVWTDDQGAIISDADTAFVTTEGEFFVQVIDSNGCEAMSSIMVEIQDFLVPNISGDTSICPLACTELNAGSGYTSYEWSTSENTQTIEVCSPGTYAVTVFDAGGCSGEQLRVVTENDLPLPQITGENNAISFCPGDDLELDAGPGYSTYSWNTDESNQTITVSTAGTYIVTVTDAENCEGITEIIIEENIPPDPNFTGLTTFCPGDSVLITPEDGYELYEIDIDNNGSVDITNTTNDPFYVAIVGNSNIIVTDENGCVGSIIVGVDEFTSPQPVGQIDTASYCVNGSVFIGITEDFDNVDWYLSNVNVGSGQTIEVSQQGTYEVIVQDENGCSGITSIEVIESDQLFPAITGETAICDSNPIELNAGQGYDIYDWGSNGNTQIIEVTEEGIYTVTVTDAGGCMGIATVTVSESSTPSAEVAENFFICNNSDGDNISNVSFDGLVTGSQGFWVDTDGTGVDLSDLSNVDFTGVLPGFYTFTYETSIAIAPCVNQFYTTTIEVNECSCPSLQLKDLDPLCVDGNIVDLDTLKITSESGFWTVDQGDGNVLTGSIFDPNSGSGGTYVLTFNLDEAKENCDSTRSIMFELIEPPTTGTASAPLKICLDENQNVDLSLLLEGEDSGGEWTETSIASSTGGAFNSASGSFSTIDQTEGVYTFEYMLDGVFPCGSASIEVEVELVPLPIADAGEDKMLNCDLLVVEVGTNNSSGTDLVYNWTEDKGLVIDNPNGPIIDVDEAGMYMLEITDGNNCVDIDTAIVDQNMNFPDVSLEGVDPFCADENTGAIVATGMGGEGPYTFSLDNGQTFTDANAFMDLTSGTYTIIVQDQNMCTDEITIDLNNPQTFIADLGNNIVIQNQEDTLITLDVTGGLENFGAAIWTVNDSIVCQGPECISYNVNLEEDADVCVVVTSQLGCVDSTCIQIRSIVINTTYTGNTFSPDDDGVNDIFFVQGDDIASVNYFRIFNRWGEQVFEAQEFPPNNPTFGWNGNFKDTSVNPGVYTYVMEVVYLTGDSELITGDVTVVK